MVVLHYTAMKSCRAALERLCDPVAEVSAHYLISRDGALLTLVPEEARAWHAGAGSWGSVGDVNSRSIGVELDNDGETPFPEPQMRALEEVLTGIFQRWDMRPERVIGHSDMAPQRKVDPGSRFDWRRLALQGLSVWPEAKEDMAPDAERFRTLARRFGYPDAGDADVLDAFRLRFRPGAAGALAPRDMALIAALAERFPVDDALATS